MKIKGKSTCKLLHNLSQRLFRAHSLLTAGTTQKVMFHLLPNRISGNFGKW